jgi:hypothetical protein
LVFKIFIEKYGNLKLAIKNLDKKKINLKYVKKTERQRRRQKQKKKGSIINYQRYNLSSRRMYIVAFENVTSLSKMIVPFINFNFHS